MLNRLVLRRGVARQGRQNPSTQKGLVEADGGGVAGSVPLGEPGEDGVAGRVGVAEEGVALTVVLGAARDGVPAGAVRAAVPGGAAAGASAWSGGRVGRAPDEGAPEGDAGADGVAPGTVAVCDSADEPEVATTAAVAAPRTAMVANAAAARRPRRRTAGAPSPASGGTGPAGTEAGTEAVGGRGTGAGAGDVPVPARAAGAVPGSPSAADIRSAPADIADGPSIRRSRTGAEPASASRSGAPSGRPVPSFEPGAEPSEGAAPSTPSRRSVPPASFGVPPAGAAPGPRGSMSGA
jgi:hypothetical protein